MHKKPVPLIGGLAIFYGFVVSVLCFVTIEREIAGILIGSLIVVIVGIIDDMSDMKAIIKLLCQIIAAAIAVQSGVRIEHFANPFFGWFGPEYLVMNYWVSVTVTMIWIVGVCNAVNLIDGLDGLAVGVSSIASMSLLALTLISNNPNIAILTAAVAGAGFGFLPYNFNPAKIFMGDTGALFLGFILACISVEGFLKLSAIISFAVPLLVLGLPIFDTLFSIVPGVQRSVAYVAGQRTSASSAFGYGIFSAPDGSDFIHYDGGTLSNRSGYLYPWLLSGTFADPLYFCDYYALFEAYGRTERSGDIQ